MTERYDNQRVEAVRAAVARLEDGTTFDAVRLATQRRVSRAAVLVRLPLEHDRMFTY